MSGTCKLRCFKHCTLDWKKLQYCQHYMNPVSSMVFVNNIQKFPKVFGKLCGWRNTICIIKISNSSWQVLSVADVLINWSVQTREGFANSKRPPNGVDRMRILEWFLILSMKVKLLYWRRKHLYPKWIRAWEKRAEKKGENLVECWAPERLCYDLPRRIFISKIFFPIIISNVLWAFSGRFQWPFNAEVQ